VRRLDAALEVSQVTIPVEPTKAGSSRRLASSSPDEFLQTGHSRSLLSSVSGMRDLSLSSVSREAIPAIVLVRSVVARESVPERNISGTLASPPMTLPLVH